MIDEWKERLFSFILIVDDDDQIRHLLCALLDASGYKVRPASDGVVAINILSNSLTSRNPIFICPEMSGFELLPFVRKQFPSTRVVAMSGEYSGYDCQTESLPMPSMQRLLTLVIY
jgi:DNA-binding response OmpR family regulator